MFIWLMSQSNMFITQLTYLFKNKFKISQIWFKQDRIKLIMSLLGGSIQINFVWCILT